MRCIGINIHYSPAQTTPSLELISVATNSSLILNSSDSESLTRWHAQFELPSTLPPGLYEAIIHNGVGSARLCTFINSSLPCLSYLTVSKPAAWPTQQFTVKSEQPGYGRNATSAVHAAVASAAAAGGGVVFLPRGQYFVTGPIILPPKTVLRGASRELTAIYFNEDNASTAPGAYITGSAESFGVEAISIYVTSFANNVVQFGPGTTEGFIKDSRIRFNSYFCLEPTEGKGSRGRITAWSTDQGTAVKIAGRNVQVTTIKLSKLALT